MVISWFINFDFLTEKDIPNKCSLVRNILFLLVIILIVLKVMVFKPTYLMNEERMTGL
jgi:hypothetical protein